MSGKEGWAERKDKLKTGMIKEDDERGIRLH
jgi:hypothetical protein